MGHSWITHCWGKAVVRVGPGTIMCDHFGRSRSEGRQRGPMGPQGASGLTVLTSLMPGAIIQILRSHDLESCFLVTKKNRDFPAQKWVTRCDNGQNLVTVHGVAKTREINAGCRWCVVFGQGTVMSSADIYFLTPVRNSIGFICVTFRTKASGEQIVLSSFDSSRPDFVELRCTATEIVFNCGKFREIVQYDCSEWLTFYLEYRSDAHNTAEWTYQVATVTSPISTGRFNTPALLQRKGGFTMGGRKNDPENCFTGEIAAYETYYKYGVSHSYKNFPPAIRDLLIKDQLVAEDYHCQLGRQ